METNFTPNLGEVFETNAVLANVFRSIDSPGYVIGDIAITPAGATYEWDGDSWNSISIGGPGGGSQTPWASNIDGGGFNLTNAGNITLASTKRFSGIGAVKLVADGPALLASTPDYAGQITVAADGLFSIAFGTDPSNHTGGLVMANSVLYYNSLVKIGSGGDITAGNVTCGTLGCGVITSAAILGTAIAGTDHVLQCTGGTFSDNVLNIFNSTGGYSTIAFWDPEGALINGDQLAIGMAPAGVFPYAEGAYFETNALDPSNAAPNIIFSQYANTSGGGNINHVRIKMDGTARTTTLYGWDNAAALGPVGLTVGTTGAVTFGIGVVSSGLVTVTQATANTGILASTGYSLTGTNATSMIDLAGTWNTSGNPVALKLAITNTASGASAKFLSFLAGAAGATEVVSVLKGGQMGLEGTPASASYSLSCASLNIAGGINLSTTAYFQFTDVTLWRDAANTLALRNGTNAQTFRVYNTFTDASNYERITLSGRASDVALLSEKGGSGTIRPMSIGVQGAASLQFVTNSANRWVIDSSGHLIAATGAELLKWGTTSSFPSLKRSSAQLHCRLADDSADAVFQALQFNVAGTQVVGTQGAAVSDVSASDATDEASVITLANEMKQIVNTILTRIRTHGLIAT